METGSSLIVPLLRKIGLNDGTALTANTLTEEEVTGLKCLWCGEDTQDRNVWSPSKTAALPESNFPLCYNFQHSWSSWVTLKDSIHPILPGKTHREPEDFFAWPDTPGQVSQRSNDYWSSFHLHFSIRSILRSILRSPSQSHTYKKIGFCHMISSYRSEPIERQIQNCTWIMY